MEHNLTKQKKTSRIIAYNKKLNDNISNLQNKMTKINCWFKKKVGKNSVPNNQ